MGDKWHAAKNVKNQVIQSCGKSNKDGNTSTLSFALEERHLYGCDEFYVEGPQKYTDRYAHFIYLIINPHNTSEGRIDHPTTDKVSEFSDRLSHMP